MPMQEPGTKDTRLGGYDGEIISKGVEGINVLTSEKVFVIVHPDSRVKHYWNARTKTWTPFADAAAILNALGYDPVNSLIKDPVEFAEYVRKMADLAVDILKTIDNKL